MRLGRWLVGLLVLVELAVVAAEIGHLNLLDRLVAGEDVTFEEVVASDERVGVTALLDGTLSLVTVVVWIVWFRRAYGNVTRLARIEPRFGKGWAIGPGPRGHRRADRPRRRGRRTMRRST